MAACGLSRCCHLLRPALPSPLRCAPSLPSARPPPPLRRSAPSGPGHPPAAAAHHQRQLQHRVGGSIMVAATRSSRSRPAGDADGGSAPDEPAGIPLAGKGVTKRRSKAAGGAAGTAPSSPAAAAAAAGGGVGDGSSGAAAAAAGGSGRGGAAGAGAAAAAAAGAAAGLSLQGLLLEPSWRGVLAPVLASDVGRQLETFLARELAAGGPPVLPPRELLFNAFNACPFDQVRVVILGQDPYPSPGEAVGLAFSVQRGVKVPGSLRNIYKELSEDLGWGEAEHPQHGDLSGWARQGVLLLNAVLTLRQGQPRSHKGRGWEQLTSAAVASLSAQRAGLVFLLWGNDAKEKAALIDSSRHHVLLAAHPSPLSASRGFLGCRHFSRANALLLQQGVPPIDWRVLP